MFFVDLLPIYLLRQVLSFFSIPLKLFTDGYHIVVISKDKKMVERRVEVVWVPQKPSHFMTWGSDIRLYRTLDCTEGRADNWDQIGPHR